MKEGTVRMRGHADEVMNRPVTAAVIVAAGASTRMGVPKQLIPLRGILPGVRMLDENMEKLWAKIRKLV